MALADPKPPRRIVDLQAMQRARLREPNCVACGVYGTTAHHVLARSQGGDDVPGNLAGLCGSGTTGCHGRVEANDPVVRRLVGEYVRYCRPDVIEYLSERLIHESPGDYLARRYG